MNSLHMDGHTWMGPDLRQPGKQACCVRLERQRLLHGLSPWWSRRWGLFKKYAWSWRSGGYGYIKGVPMV